MAGNDTPLDTHDQRNVTAVIPGRDCADTLRLCLESLIAIRDDPTSTLHEIVFVDDGSHDNSLEIAAACDNITVLQGSGTGPGAARNIGWRYASTPVIWFVDADCVSEPDALEQLAPLLAEKQFAGASGSYGIQNPDSLLATLIHEEIIVRHRRMQTGGDAVDFLATFNVLYQRDVLEEVGGFDERFLKGQDAELSFRVMEAGHRLGFTMRSRVRHVHESKLSRYLSVQRRQGHWRVHLHLRHKGHSGGDSYSSVLDHVQPIAAFGSVATLPLVLAGFIDPDHAWLLWLALIPGLFFLATMLASLPMTFKMLSATRRPSMLCFIGLSTMRAYWRAAGLFTGTLQAITGNANNDLPATVEQQETT